MSSAFLLISQLVIHSGGKAVENCQPTAVSHKPEVGSRKRADNRRRRAVCIAGRTPLRGESTDFGLIVHERRRLKARRAASGVRGGSWPGSSLGLESKR